MARLRRRRAKPFPFIAKARANTPHLLSGPLAKGDALLHGGDKGAGELGCLVNKWIIARGHRVLYARLQVSQVA